MDKRRKWYAGPRVGDIIAVFSEIKYARVDCVVPQKS